MNTEPKDKCFVVYHEEEGEPIMTGWWLVLLDLNGETYDSAGAYETKEEAERVARETGLEVIEAPKEPWKH